jgi:type II secretory pathway pseudopilin PulG
MIMKKYIQNDSGFTLLEFVLVFAIIGVLVISSGPFIRTNLESIFKLQFRKDRLQSTRIALDLMMTDVQQIMASDHISLGSSNQIIFDLVDDNAGNISYAFSNGQLLRNSQPLINNVQNLTIRYFRGDGTEKTAAFANDTDVWRISVELSIMESGNLFFIRRQVSPRNFHYQNTT